MPLANFKNAILNFPDQLKGALEIVGEKSIDKKFEKIIVCGMGGSGLPADLVKLVADADIEAHKNYAPEKFPPEALIICISYSGNTEETISCYKKAQEQNLDRAAITTGGKLEELATEKSDLLLKIPKTNIQPRWATGYLWGSLVAFLENSGVCENQKKNLKELSDILSPESLKPTGKEIAQKTENRTPLIYSSKKNRAIGYYWKIAFNENVKLHAFSNVFPEANHNEIEAYETVEKPLHVVTLEDKTDHPRIKERFRVFKSIVEKHKLEFTSVDVKQRNRAEKIINFILLANWTVYYYAKINDIDPEPVKLIEEFKELISYKKEN